MKSTIANPFHGFHVEKKKLKNNFFSNEEFIEQYIHTAPCITYTYTQHTVKRRCCVLVNLNLTLTF